MVPRSSHKVKMFRLLTFVCLFLLFSCLAYKNTPPPGTVFKSIEVCRQIQSEIAWFPRCITPECLAKNYDLWPQWVSSRKQCTFRCQLSFGVSCMYGDLYTKAQNGIMQNLWCQCSGLSSKNICKAKRLQMYQITKNPLRSRKQVTQTCRKWCENGDANTVNQNHCDLSAITAFAGVNQTVVPINKVAFSNLTCSCDSSA